jgi:hypothetical protein
MGPDHPRSQKLLLELIIAHSLVLRGGIEEQGQQIVLFAECHALDAKVALEVAGAFANRRAGTSRMANGDWPFPVIHVALPLRPRPNGVSQLLRQASALASALMQA